MRRRKLHGLAGSAEHHASRVSALEHRASNMFKTSTILARDSRCESAIDEYADAVRAMGMAQVHQVESGRESKHTGDVLRNFTVATARLKDICMIGTKLGGMSRRKRRR